MKNIGQAMLMGIAVGDALGVPFEFSSREEMKKTPAKDMVGFRVHNQPTGTWSDDSSLTFCLAESLVNGYSLESAARNFIKWKNQAYWSARGNVFDIGMTTSRAISRLEKVCNKYDGDMLTQELKLLKYGGDESENGNGSLMRILPLLYEIKGKDTATQFEMVWENSTLTHRHIRAAMSCLIYLKMVEYMWEGKDKMEAYQLTRKEIFRVWEELSFSDSEKNWFSRIIQSDITQIEINKINSGGYVIESLEASFWCFLNSDSYEEAVLKAINLGHDTDTTGAITGGLAGIYYGLDVIPEFWRTSIVRMEDIIALGEQLDQKYK